MGLLKKNKKIYLIVTLILLLFFSWSVLSQPTIKKNETILINNQEIKVEVAATNAKRYQGLSGRKSLCANCGMFFKFPSSLDLDFVMRDMKFPLDIIFINDGRIIKIAENLAPEGHEPQQVYSSNGLANQALEVNGGFSRKFGINVGDFVEESN